MEEVNRTTHEEAGAESAMRGSPLLDLPNEAPASPTKRGRPAYPYKFKRNSHGLSIYKRDQEEMRYLGSISFTELESHFARKKQRGMIRANP